MKKKNDILSKLKEFWHFIWHDDSLLSYVLNFALAFIFIKYIFFPGLGFALQTDYPIVAIVSGSMEHKVVNGKVCYENYLEDRNLDFDSWYRYCGSYYEKNFGLNKSEFYDFEYRNGLNIGDVMVLRGKNPSKIEVGDILVFNPQDKVYGDLAQSLNMKDGSSFFMNAYGPVIHRVVDKWQDDNGDWHFTTKGDHNAQTISNHKRLNNQVSFTDFESDIPQDDVIGVVAFRIPYLGYAKIVLNKIYLFVVGLV